MRLEGVSPALRIPERAFLEVVEILLRNAVEAMNGSGEGSVEMVCEPTRFRTLIRDHGTGLTPETLDEIFKPGYTTKPKGSGYGLFLARRITKEYGGQLSARASGPTTPGAIFELSLPLARSQAEAASGVR